MFDSAPLLADLGFRGSASPAPSTRSECCPGSAQSFQRTLLRTDGAARRAVSQLVALAQCRDAVMFGRRRLACASAAGRHNIWGADAHSVQMTTPHRIG